MRRIALVSCVSKKQNAPTKARDQYISDWFKKAREYVEGNYDAWYILSAEYGLLFPDQLISPYNKSLKDIQPINRKQWALQVYQALTAIEQEPCQADIFAGRLYRQHLGELLKQQFVVAVPLANMGIGQQLSWFKKNRVCNFNCGLTKI